MVTKVYVDVLLVLNYIVNTVLLSCTAKLTGQRPKRRRMVAAALIGSASALAIFLPFMGFASELLLKLTVAVIIIRAAFPFTGRRRYLKQLFVFFAVSFMFAGTMLALWLLFAPRGMLYYNGIVYFDISSGMLLVSTAAAYGLLTLAHRFARDGRVRTAIYEMEVQLGSRTLALQGLVDTGNTLAEPFSGLPVIVCALEDAAALLPAGAAQAAQEGHLSEWLAEQRIAVRLVPYGSVGGGGLIPALRPDRVVLHDQGDTYEAGDAFLGLAGHKIGGTGYNALLPPDLIGLRI